MLGESSATAGRHRPASAKASRAPEVYAEMDCLTEDTIIEFLQGQLSEEETEIAERHMDQCQDCRLLVAELARTSFSEHPTPAPASQSKRMFKPLLYAAADGYVIDPNAVGDGVGSTDPWLMDHRPTFKLRKDDSGATVAEEIDTDPGHPAPMGRLGPGFCAFCFVLFTVTNSFNRNLLCRVGDHVCGSLEIGFRKTMDIMVCRKQPRSVTTQLRGEFLYPHALLVGDGAGEDLSAMN